MAHDIDLGVMVTALLRAEGPNPDPRHVAEVIAQAVGADSCILFVVDQTYRWDRPGAVPAEHAARWGRWDIRIDPLISVRLSPPETMPSGAALAPIMALLSARAWANEEARLERDATRLGVELADHRWRAAGEMEHERRLLERDMHDGAQHHLVALRMTAALAEIADGTPEGPEQREFLREKLDETERVLIATARGVLPPALAELGLRGALLALQATDVEVIAEIGSLKPAVESALYFIALEAVSNARKHAPGAHITVIAAADNRSAQVRVSDAGGGFAVSDPAAPLPKLAARAAAVGGRIVVQSAPGAGTQVIGVVPL